jgi:hypothetical protein
MPQLSGKKSNWEWSICTFKDILRQSVIQWRHALNQFLAVFCPGIPQEVTLHRTKCVPGFLLITPAVGCSKYRLWKGLYIWWPTKTPPL